MIRKVFLALSLLIFGLGSAQAQYQPGAVVQLPNVAAITSRNLATTPQIQVNGYYAANDGGQGTFTLMASPAPLTLSGQAHSGTNVIDTLSADPTTQHWVPGLVVTDSSNVIPANTVIVSVTSTSITLSQNVTGNATGDTLTVSANGGTILTDAGGNYFQRTNATADTRQWGLTQGSAYDAQINGSSATSATGVITKAMGVALSLGLPNIDTGQVGLYFATTLNVPVSTTLNCGATGGAPKTGANFLNIPGTVFLGHGAEIAFPSGQDVAYISHCVVLPIWYVTPSYAVANCSLNGNQGVAFNSPAQNKDDLEAIRSNMIICGDTAIHFIQSSGGKSNNVWAFGFDAGWFADRADHSNSTDIYLDDNICFYLKRGGGQTDFGNTDCAQYLTRQVKTNGGTGSFIKNEQNWSITNIVAASTTNSFGQKECQLALAVAADPVSVTELHSSTTNAQGDPISYPAWVYNLTNFGSNPSGAVSCRGYGAFPVQVVSTDPGTNTAVVVLKGSAFAHGADAITLTGTWASGSQWVYITSGNVNALSIGETVTASGISATVDSVCRTCKGQHPYDPYIAAIHISAASTLAGTDGTLTFDSGAFVPDSTPCQQDSNASGYCFTYNQAERTTAGNSTAATDLAALPISQGHHYGVCFAINGTAGSFNSKPYCYGHRFGYVVQDANNSSFVQEGGDDNGELNDFGQYFISFMGGSNQSAFFGQQGGKAGVAIVNNLYEADEDTGTLSTTISNVNGITTGLGTMTLASSPTVPNGGRFNVDICQNLANDGSCSKLGQGNYETATVKITGSSMQLIARGQYFSPALTFTNGAHVIYTALSAPTGCASLDSTSDPTTQGGLNGLEAVSGCLMMTNVRINGTRQMVITHNATSTIINGSSIPAATFLYEDATALASMSGCGNVLLNPAETWQCNVGGVLNGVFTPTGATTATGLPDFGDRALSLLDFGAKPDWTTNATLNLTAAESAALARNIHIIRLDPSALGSGYLIGTHTVPSGILLYCPGPTATPPTSNDFRNFPNSIVLTGTAGLKLSAGSGILGCNVVHQSLETAAPAANYQDNYARSTAFASAGTGVTCQGDGCIIQQGMIAGFSKGVVLKGAKTAFLKDLQVDATTCFTLGSQGGGGGINVSNTVCAPYATRSTAFTTVTLPITSLTNSGGSLLATLASSCTGSNCPLAGQPVWVINPNGTQSAQGPWTAGTVTATTVVLSGSTSDFITGHAEPNAVVTAGSTFIGGLTTNLSQIQPTQTLSGATCIPAGAVIMARSAALGGVWVDAAHVPNCTVTETVTITDAASGTTTITAAPINAAGTGYTVGDILNPTGGTVVTGQDAILTVTGVDDTTGAITSADLTDGGQYTVCPPAGSGVSGGTGTGATFNFACSAALVLYAANRTGPAFDISNVNAVNITNSQNLSHATGMLLGKNTNGVFASNVELHDENYIQDQSHLGIVFTNNAKSNVITNCGSYYFGAAVAVHTQSGVNISDNVVKGCFLGGSSGASGFQNTLLDVASFNSSGVPTPGTPMKSGITMSDITSNVRGVMLITDDVRSVQFSNSQTFQTPIYCQSDTAASKILGAALVTGGGCQFTTPAPNSINSTITPSSTAAVYLHSCGASVSSASAGGTLPVYLPFPVMTGCRAILRPSTNTIQVNGNGASIRLVDLGAVNTAINLAGNPGAPVVTLEYDGVLWRATSGAPGTMVENNLANGQRRAHGQVYFSYDSGNSRLQLCPLNGNGIIINSIMTYLPGCIYLPVSNFSSVTSALRYVYATRATATVTGIADDGSGHAQLTLASVTGFQSGDPITCYNMTGTPLANVVDDTNTVLSGSTITLTDISFVANTGVAGNCQWTGLVQVATPHVTDANGIEVRSGLTSQSLVGAVWVDGSHLLNDSLTKRDVASWFNRQPKSCVNGFTADRTTASDTFVEVNAETECEFVTWGAVSLAGVPIPEQRWATSGMMGNDTASDGVLISVGFDGATAQTQTSGFKNAAAGGGGAGNAASSGSVPALAEGKHYATILGRRVTGGTATFYGTTPVTTVTIPLMQ